MVTWSYKDKNNFLGIGSLFLLTDALYMGAYKHQAKIKIFDEYIQNKILQDLSIENLSSRNK